MVFADDSSALAEELTGFDAGSARADDPAAEELAWAKAPLLSLKDVFEEGQSATTTSDLQFTATTFTEWIVITEEIRSVAASDFITDVNRTKYMNVGRTQTRGDKLEEKKRSKWSATVVSYFAIRSAIVIDIR